ncbi:MAG: hypothetical protein RL175_521, partial [Pseudomonadota bacterium]
TFDELTHARIAACGVKVDFDDGLRRCFHAHAHGVKAEENFGGGRHKLGLSLDLPRFNREHLIATRRQLEVVRDQDQRSA